jgi:hypothetical protein
MVSTATTTKQAAQDIERFIGINPLRIETKQVTQSLNLSQVA